MVGKELKDRRRSIRGALVGPHDERPPPRDYDIWDDGCCCCCGGIISMGIQGLSFVMHDYKSKYPSFQSS